MTEQWSVPVWAVLAASIAVLAVLSLLWAASARRARAVADLQIALAAEAETRAQLSERLVRLERSQQRAVASEQEFVITHLGADDADPRPVAEPAPVVPAAVFADIVLRESVVQLGSLAAGVRRVLRPETRARIRIEMRRELKRARKQRRSDTRQARREWEARQRAATT